MSRAKKVEIQTLPQGSQKWKNIHLSQVKYSHDAIYVGAPFRIRVDDETIYEIRKEI